MLSFINNISIKNKLILPIILFVSVAFVTIQSINYTVTFEREKQNLIQRVKVLAQGVAYNLQAAILFEDKASANEILSAFVADEDIVRVKLFDTQEQLFASYQIGARIFLGPPAKSVKISHLNNLRFQSSTSIYWFLWFSTTKSSQIYVSPFQRKHLRRS